MSRRPLYSRSGKPRTEGRSPLVAADGITPAYIDTPDEPKGPPLRQRAAQGWTRLQQRHPSMVLVATSVVVMLIGIGAYNYLRPEPQDLSQGRLNEAVNYAIDHRPEQPAETTVDYAKIIPSVVRVDGYDPIVPNESGSPDERQAAAEGHGQVTPPLSTNSALPGYENVAVGTGTRDDKGHLQALAVKEGDMVLFSKWSGTEVTIDGEELLVVKESDIMGIIDGKKKSKAA